MAATPTPQDQTETKKTSGPIVSTDLLAVVFDEATTHYGAERTRDAKPATAPKTTIKTHETRLLSKPNAEINGILEYSECVQEDQSTEMALWLSEGTENGNNLVMIARMKVPAHNPRAVSLEINAFYSSCSPEAALTAVSILGMLAAHHKRSLRTMLSTSGPRD